MRLLYISKGSAGEVRTQLYLAKDLNYINDSIFNDILIKTEVISKSLSSFIKYLQSTI